MKLKTYNLLSHLFSVSNVLRRHTSLQYTIRSRFLHSDTWIRLSEKSPRGEIV